MDVVVDDGIAILQVLPLRDAIGSNQQVNVRIAGVAVRIRPGFGRPAVAGDGRKVGQDGVEIVVAHGSMRFIAGHHCDVDAQLLRQPAQLPIQVLRRILKGGEHQQLAVGVAVPVLGRIRRLFADLLLDFRQLAVPFRRNRLDRRQHRRQRSPILPQIIHPARQIQLRQAVGMPPPVDEKLVVIVIIIGRHIGAGQIVNRRPTALLIAFNFAQQVVNFADGAL